MDQPAGGPLTAVFVYGTLKQGHVRWPLLEPLVVGDPEPATVPGRLFDTGLDFPAARFDLEGTIEGELFELRPATADEALTFLDEVEGAAHGLYGRVRVTTDDGREAWAYEFGGDVGPFTDLDGRWTGA